jgi:hypothetical protein
MTNAIAAVRSALGIRRHRRRLPRGPQPAPGCMIFRSKDVGGNAPDIGPSLSIVRRFL